MIIDFINLPTIAAIAELTFDEIMMWFESIFYHAIKAIQHVFYTFLFYFIAPLFLSILFWHCCTFARAASIEQSLRKMDRSTPTVNGLPVRFYRRKFPALYNLRLAHLDWCARWKQSYLTRQTFNETVRITKVKDDRCSNICSFKKCITEYVRVTLKEGWTQSMSLLNSWITLNIHKVSIKLTSSRQQYFLINFYNIADIFIFYFYISSPWWDS